MVNVKINKKQKTGRRLEENHIKIQQLKNQQFIITLPKIWAQILEVKKGSIITFKPGSQGGIELLKIDKKKP